MKLFQSVRARIYMAFGAMAMLLVITGGAAIYLMTEAEHLFSEYRHTARQSLKIDENLRDVSLLRFDFLNYLLKPTAEWASAAREVAVHIEQEDASTTELFAGDEQALAVIAEVRGLATQYLAGFDTIVAAQATGTNPANHSMTATLTSIGPRMYGLYDELSSAAHNKQNELGPRIAQQEQLQLLIITIISAIGLVVGVGLAIITGRWLSSTFAGLTGTMGKLTDGDYDITISGTQAQNELGEMARALETFRLNGINVQLAEEEKQARANDIAARAEKMAQFQAAFDAVIERAIAGDFSARVAARFGDAELDRIGGNIDGMLESIEEALDEAERVLGAMARADLRDRMMGDYKGAFGKLKESTNSVADKIEAITLQLRETSRALKLATGEILAGANDLSERTTKQAATIEETSAAMEQLAGTVGLNAERAREASHNADKMTNIAESSSAVMAQATDAMDRITQSSAKISNIIGLIDDIAFQTNLLALNASVEAARAGEAGKGFAVVAVEVRRLAQNAAQASSDVKQLIEQSGEEVRGGSKLVSDVAGRLSEIVDGVKSSANLMESIAKDSEAQASGIAEVNIAVRQMDEMTQHNAALVEEMNASIEQTEGQATRLDEIVDTFTLNEAGAPTMRAEKPAAAKTAPAGGARNLIKSVQRAAKTYFGGGAAAVAEDWNEF
jgi:methyl-accepting chemotaxis protein